MSVHKYTNALANETSPYLLQHAHNPVEWHPWNEKALSKARKEDKPILLSIGYSACHWCHVMEHESFEDEQIANLMNENFINIKVDREERPDLDAIYMAAVQMMTGSGGWPMTVFLTPDQIPFYCGTYFPKEDQYGRPGFRRVLLSVAQAYRENKQAIHDSAQAIVAELRKSDFVINTQNVLDISILEMASTALIANYDSRNGGFGQAPKFPPSMVLSYLMRSHARTGKTQYLDIVNTTLTKMANGGIYDQLGGGFHRYSVDDHWLVPHFEKMLYDNALLSRAYLDAFLLTKNSFFRRIGQETLDYVLREMTSPEGGFYSSQDADSEGREGEFFLWTTNEVLTILGEEEGELFCRYYGITPGGNFEGKNILNVPRSADIAAKLNNTAEDHLLEIIQRGRQKLFKARELRSRPGRDEKVLTSWNGLMLRSFAEASNSLDRDDYRQTAVRNAEFLLSRLRHDGRLRRSYRDGQARFNAYLEDYACLVDGLISLYEATFDPEWIRQAEGLAGQMIQLFWDPKGAGFYFTSEDHEALIQRPKNFYDNATPSGNSVAASSLLRLWKLTGDRRYSQYAVAVLESISSFLPRHPAAFPHSLCALDFYLGKAKEIAIIGDPLEKNTNGLLAAVFHEYLPNKVVACGEDGGLFLLENKTRIHGLATAYVCEDFTCKLPLTEPKELSKMLETETIPYLSGST
jgi:uncharacterized protein YyaL (SSP411 family)